MRRRSLPRIVLQPEYRRVTKDGEEVDLTRSEMNLLLGLSDGLPKTYEEAYLSMHKGESFFPKDFSNIIRVHLYRVRMKLGQEAVVPLRGYGYKLGESVEVLKEWSRVKLMGEVL